MKLPTDLEPAVRDPRKLRRTAWILVAIMVIGAVLILTAYEKMAREQYRDSRPAYIHEIRPGRELEVALQDGSRGDLRDLRGSVWAVHASCLGQPDRGARSLAVMKRLAADYAGRADFRLVTLVIDPPPAEEAAPTLGAAAAAHGIALPQWWLATTGAETLHKFIKNELKAGMLPHRNDGRWEFDTAIVLIDRSGHIRRAVVPKTRNGKPARPEVVAFDFDQAARWDRDGLQSGSERSNEQELELLLAQTIDTLLAEPSESR